MNHATKMHRRNTLLDPEEPIGTVPNRRTFSSAELIPEDGGEDARMKKRTTWNLDADIIVEKMKTNRTFKVAMEFDVKGLPVFADLLRYDVSETKQQELFGLEIRRLVGVINSGKPAELEGDPSWFGKADTDGYKRLDRLVKQISLALSICSHDLQLQLLEHAPADSIPDYFKASREEILEYFGQDSHKTPTETWSDMKLAQFNDKALHAVTNYLTATMLQVLLRTVNGEFWDHNCIIAMAKCAAKIKVVSMNLANAAQVCLAGKREWAQKMANMSQKEPNPPSFEDKDQQRTITPSGKQQDSMARCIFTRNQRYFTVMSAFGNGVMLLLDSVLTLATNLDAGEALPPDVFEICSVVYDTGFRGRRSILCQERNRAIGVSASRNHVHCASFAFEVCLKSLEALSDRLESPAGTPNPNPSTSEATTTVYWKWTELGAEKDDFEREEDIFKDKPRTGEHKLSSMADVISAIVPFSVVSGNFCQQLSSLTQLVTAIADDGDPLSMCSETRFLAAFMMQTSEHEKQQKRPLSGGAGVTSVSKYHIVESRALAHGPTSSLSRNRSTDADDSDYMLRKQLLTKNKVIRAGLDMVDTWTLDRSSITIQYRGYCWGVLSFCAILVLGGLAIGFTLNERVRGVDPFNISVFCWVLAGFITVVAKSLRVENWSWRDFIGGKVVCRSVSEVVAVSGIDAQLLLSILLRIEAKVIMNKEGPFRAVFFRRDDNTAGFSIDVPLNTHSLADSGCFLIKVMSSTGPALILIRGTDISDYQLVKPRSMSSDGERMKCQHLREPGKWGTGDGQKCMYTLSSNQIVWSKVMGIFSEVAYFC